MNATQTAATQTQNDQQVRASFITTLFKAVEPFLEREWSSEPAELWAQLGVPDYDTFKRRIGLIMYRLIKTRPVEAQDVPGRIACSTVAASLANIVRFGIPLTYLEDDVYTYWVYAHHDSASIHAGRFVLEAELMYHGWLKILYAAGVKWVEANTVCAGDTHFRFFRTPDGSAAVEHEFGKDARGEILKAYALIRHEDHTFGVVMERHEIKVIQEISSSRVSRGSHAAVQGSPWEKFPEEMIKKSALKRCLKLVPIRRDFVPFMYAWKKEADEWRNGKTSTELSGTETDIPPATSRQPSSPESAVCPEQP